MLKKISLVALSAATLFASSALANNLAGAAGTLENIDSALNEAVHQAERLFEENHGVKLTEDYKLIDHKDNPYIHTLTIDKNYHVLLKFDGDPKKSRQITSPVAKALLATEIRLIPVYNKDDEKVTAWECLTNADNEVQKFMGDRGTKEYSASYIREYTDNKYLSLCVYIDKNLVGCKHDGHRH